MGISIQYFLFILIGLISKGLTQHQRSTMLTCYTIYERQHTRSQNDNSLLSYSYHQKEITVHSTVEYEKCEVVGCVCFSYKSSCSNPSAGKNHHSNCNSADQQNGTVKWFYGWTSKAKCAEMRYDSRKFTDLTCCETDRCNNQPGLVVNRVDPSTNPQLVNPEHRPGESYNGFVSGHDALQLLDNHKPWEPNPSHQNYPTQQDHPNHQDQPSHHQNYPSQQDYQSHQDQPGHHQNYPSQQDYQSHQNNQGHENYPSQQGYPSYQDQPGHHQNYAGQQDYQSHQNNQGHENYPSQQGHPSYQDQPGHQYYPSQQNYPSHEGHQQNPSAAQPVDDAHKSVSPYYPYSPDSAAFDSTRNHHGSAQSHDNNASESRTTIKGQSGRARQRTTKKTGNTTVTPVTTSSTSKSTHRDSEFSSQGSFSAMNSFNSWLMLFSISFYFRYIMRSH